MKIPKSTVGVSTGTVPSNNIEKVTSKLNSSQKKFKLYTTIEKYRASGYDNVAEFLDAKAKRSKATAFSYEAGVKNWNRFIESKYEGKNIQTILPDIKSGKEDVYKLFNNFINYLQTKPANGVDLSPRSIFLYVASVRSYLEYNDIEITPSRFKNRVTMPRIYKEDEEALDANDIKAILQKCNNPRLKAYLLVLASGGMRAMEALAIRESDIDFTGINFDDPSDTSEPASIKIRAEYSKTRVGRRIFISNEAARYLKDWINWIYRDKSQGPYLATRRITRQRSPDDLIFSRRAYRGVYPLGLYDRLLSEFQKVLILARLADRKEDSVYKRRKITFHSFRRFVKTTIANQTRNSDYSEWFLGHSKSPYYTNKPDELRRIYKEDCMKYLTFLDYTTVEATGKSFEAKLRQKDKEIEALKTQVRMITKTEEQKEEHATAAMDTLMQVIEGMKKQIKELQDNQNQKR